MEMNQKVSINLIQKSNIRYFFVFLELIDKREEIVTRFKELSEAVQVLLDAVVTEDAARLIEHQR